VSEMSNVTSQARQQENDVTESSAWRDESSGVRRQASDPWLTLITVGESGDWSLPGPLPDVGSSVTWSWCSVGRLMVKDDDVFIIRGWLITLARGC